MTREELFEKICPAEFVKDCWKNDNISSCNECRELLNKMMDAYDSSLKQEWAEKLSYKLFNEVIK